MATATTEVPAEQQGQLPQLNTATFESQLIWLAIVFVALYVVVSRLVLPRVDKVLGDREENIAGNLDTAERLRSEAEEIKAVYEASVAEARANAQKAAVAAKDAAQDDIAKAQAELDAKLNAEAEEATARIEKAKEEALSSLDVVAGDVARELLAKLSGAEADEAAVSKAVQAAIKEAKGA